MAQRDEKRQWGAAHSTHNKTHIIDKNMTATIDSSKSTAAASNASSPINNGHNQYPASFHFDGQLLSVPCITRETAVLAH